MQEQKIPQGYKKTEIGIIPQDWEVKKLGEICSSIKDGTHQTPKYVNFGIPFYSVENVTNNDFKNVKYISLEEHKKLTKTCNPEKGDLLLTRIGDIGTTKYIDWNIKASIYVSLALLKIKKEYDGRYLYYYSQTPKWKKEIENHSLMHATPQKINLGEIGKVAIPLPPLPEQQAIARVLSDVDRLIESLDKLIEKKKMIKKGAMQELLTGKRRLPGFTGEWVKKKLGEIAEIKKGDLITEKTAKKGDIPVIGGGIEPTYYHNKSNRGPNTITISASGANAGYVNFYPYPIFASDCSTIEENNNYDVKFLYHFLKLKQNDIIKLQTGGAQPHVYPEQLKNLMIYFPPTLEEQQAIAQILSDMDAEIEALEKKKAKYEKIKKGLMEQLLTGKIRLKNKIKEVLQ